MKDGFMVADRWECVSDDMAEILRKKTGAERLAIAHGLWRSARNLIVYCLRQENPDWTDEEIERETARRMSHGAV